MDYLGTLNLLYIPRIPGLNFPSVLASGLQTFSVHLPGRVDRRYISFTDFETPEVRRLPVLTPHVLKEHD